MKKIIKPPKTKKQKVLEPKMGDEIITTKAFEFGENMQGIIREVIDKNIFAVEFEEHKDGMHKFSDMLLKEDGYCLAKKDFNIVNQYSNSNKDKEGFVVKLRECHFTKLLNIPSDIRDLENQKRNNKSEIKSIATRTKKLEGELKKIDIEKNTIIKNAEFIPENEKFAKQYDKLISHKLINDIIINDNYLIIKTEDLTFTEERTALPDFNLGAYYMFISTTSTQKPKVINYKKQLTKGGYHHPCIERGGHLCLGSVVGNGVDKCMKNGSYIELVYLLLNFLQEPNYNGPYIEAKFFISAQPVTIKPKSIEGWLNRDEWRKEKFNQKKFDDDTNIVRNKYDI